jgi:methionyl-tRNA formyltransferase
VTESEVAQAAARHGLPLLKPATLREGEARGVLGSARCDVLVVAAFGMILPRAILELPPSGCLNIHASLLPRWRGAAPIQRAILAGDTRSGITIMRMDEGLDTGPCLLQRAIEIPARGTAGALTEALADLGAECIVEALAQLDRLQPAAQDPALATYAAKIAKSEARIDWTRTSEEIDRQVRAFNPVPGAETQFQGQGLKIWEAEPVRASGVPSTILNADPRNGLVVACGNGALRLHTVQRAGGKRLPADVFLLGGRIQPGMTLAAEAPAARPAPTR